MKAAELHAKLSVYLAQSPDNAAADVVIRTGGDTVHDMVGANDAKGMIPGHHLLILEPGGEPLGVRELKVQ